MYAIYDSNLSKGDKIKKSSRYIDLSSDSDDDFQTIRTGNTTMLDTHLHRQQLQDID